MSRIVFLTAILAFGPGLPDGCAKAFGKHGDASAQKSAQAAPLPVPAPQPVSSATAPPVWAPPDTGGPLPTPTPPPVSSDLTKAQVFAENGEHKKVRALLEKKVKTGKASRDEAVLLMESCTALRDKACLDVVKAKYPTAPVDDGN